VEFRRDPESGSWNSLESQFLESGKFRNTNSGIRGILQEEIWIGQKENLSGSKFYIPKKVSVLYSGTMSRVIYKIFIINIKIFLWKAYVLSSTIKLFIIFLIFISKLQ
jgi:hypothetical protein